MFSTTFHPTPVRTIAAKDIRDALRDRFILIVTLFLGIAALTALVTGAIALRTDVATYEAAKASLLALGKTADSIAAPEFYPLRLLRGAIEQTEIIGAAIAILTADTDGDGQNDLADANPTTLDNPIAMTGTAAPFVLTEVLVENNYDPVAKIAAADHLEILVTNIGATALTGFSIYYSFTDVDTGTVDATFRTLDGFEVPANGEARIHFDDATVAGHFRANPNSTYITTPSAKTVSVTVAAAGFAPVMAEIAKDAGGAEAAD